jgi:pyridoxal phosphate enzyme (YggS family)
MIAAELQRLYSELPQGVKLVAVSKYHPTSAILEALAAGQHIFGESHVQELQQKHTALAQEPVEWHFIGHLQTNKVKYIVPYVALIHAVDSPHLLAEINKQALRAGRTVRCLLQLHVAAEATKFGFTPDEAEIFLRSGEWCNMSGVEIAGIMTMATNTDDDRRVHEDFRTAHDFFVMAKRKFFAGAPAFTELSMGMSDDWPIAVEEGSTMVRIGTRIFGERDYSNPQIR